MTLIIQFQYFEDHIGPSGDFAASSAFRQRNPVRDQKGSSPEPEKTIGRIRTVPTTGGSRTAWDYNEIVKKLVNIGSFRSGNPFPREKISRESEKTLVKDFTMMQFLARS